MGGNSISEAAPERPHTARVAVFGGTGFLGRRVVRAFGDLGVDVVAAARRPEAVDEGAIGGVAAADVTEPSSLPAALSGVDAVVNCVGCYVESGARTFAAVHVEGAANLARAARVAGVADFVQISGIGADSSSASPYVRARGEGEAAVRDAFPGACILRPSVMFGPGGDTLAALAAFMRASPAFPLFGDGSVRLQPVFVDDVARAAAAATDRPAARGQVYELGGPDRLSYRQLAERVRRWADASTALFPAPLGVWRAFATLAAVLPRPPVTEGMVTLMSADNIASGAFPGLSDLGIAPTSMEAIAPEYLAGRSR